MAQPPISNPVSEAIDHLGGDKAVAKRAGLKTSWAVTKWRTKLPAERTIWLAKETGFTYTPHILNPVIYPNPQDGLPTKKKTRP
ncbi:helix-turn-helix domain-containing protein [Collimonas silvisoli]|uniref:YdaS family helix-turn-helix protein n=1 Tax=Collimonas silvisoli TaxID=2825884 RepID=UPI001B8ACEE3|nr:YdaS family helix-turn-helix protein [Collimonas silvisoli]